MKRLALMLAIVALGCGDPVGNDTPECRRWQASYKSAEALPSPALVQGALLGDRPEGCEIP